MVAITEAQIKREQAMEMTRREMERKSLDTIRLYNPLEHAYRYMVGGFWHSVPAKGYKDEPRYLARMYFKKIAEYMIGLQAAEQGEKLKAIREKQLGKTFIDKYEENIEIWNKVPRTDDPELLKKIKEVVIVGLVEEYGMEAPPEMPADQVKTADMRPLSDQIFDDFEKEEKRISEEAPVETKKYPINKAKLEKEVTL
jgi:hypothetical protein